DDNSPAVGREGETMCYPARRHDRRPLLGQRHTRGSANDSLERYDVDPDILDPRLSREVRMKQGGAPASHGRCVTASLEQPRARRYTRAEMTGPERRRSYPMSLSDIIWRPDPAVAERTRIARFMRRHGFVTVADLQRRSVEDLEWYWNEVSRD